MNYCPLNILSGYSFLSSTLKIEDIFKMCKSKSYSTFGICDFNNVHSYADIEKNRHIYNINSVYGSTFTYYLFKEHPIQISCYIKSEKGYQNLIQILAHYNKGISNEELIHFKEGLILVLPTLSNHEIKQSILNQSFFNYVEEIKTLFSGFDDAYIGIEIYSNDDIELTKTIRNFANKHNFKTVAFNRHQYLKKEDAIGLKILTAIKKDQKLNYKTSDGPYYFLGNTAIKTLYTQEECNNTITVAEQCSSFELVKKRGKLLSFPYQGNKKEYLKNLCYSSLKNLNLSKIEYQNRVDYELETIEKMGYLDYFLIVQDYVAFASKNNIPVGPGRGSAAGSLVSYLLGITKVDSIKYDLLFERFLNPKRTSMPDIDIDFADYRRDEIINYIKEKYNKKRIANIITFQTFGARASLRDIGRVFNIDPRNIDKILSLVEHSATLEAAYSDSLELQSLCDDIYFGEIFALAKRIEGLPRQSGLHAAGIIIDDEQLENSIPVLYSSDGSTITQFDAPFLEKLGFLKMDLLGLTNLSTIESMLKYIDSYYHASLNLEAIPLNDSKTFEILNKGLTAGIFQLESSGITKTLKEVKINNFNDIVATLALYRPGPMDNIPLYAKNKNNNLHFNCIHPILKPILEPTYGVIVYQEQIMQIVQLIAGFDLAKADLFRRAISKKDSQKLHSLKEEFIEGSLKNNITIDIANQVFNLIEKFANYGFNKAHSVSYALITYQMAYIKAHFPAAFYCCLLNNLSLNDPKISQIKKELNYFNLALSLPSFTLSSDIFSISDNKLIIPFSKIKGINKNIINNLKEIQKQSIHDFSTFMNYAEKYSIPDSAIISLINAGVFDEFNKTRQTLRKMVPFYRLFYQNISIEGNLTNEELLNFMPIIEDIKEDNKLKYELEFQALDILLSGSLLSSYKKTITTNNIRLIREQIYPLNQNYTSIAVIINSIKTIKTKKNESMAILNCQDDSQSIEVIVFPKTYAQEIDKLAIKNAYIFEGYFRTKADIISFNAIKITKMEEEL